MCLLDTKTRDTLTVSVSASVSKMCVSSERHAKERQDTVSSVFL